jgi:hypothetical protein
LLVRIKIQPLYPQVDIYGQRIHQSACTAHVADPRSPTTAFSTHETCRQVSEATRPCRAPPGTTTPREPRRRPPPTVPTMRNNVTGRRPPPLQGVVRHPPSLHHGKPPRRPSSHHRGETRRLLKADDCPTPAASSPHCMEPPSLSPGSDLQPSTKTSAPQCRP